MVVTEYSVIFLAFLFDIALGAVFLGLSLSIAQSQGVCMNYSKISSFECGFINFSDSRQKFNLNFYMVGILFVIFDIEVTLLFPWSLVAKETAHSLWVVYFFLLILALGFVLEWLKGAFEWKLRYSFFFIASSFSSVVWSSPWQHPVKEPLRCIVLINAAQDSHRYCQSVDLVKEPL